MPANDDDDLGHICCCCPISLEFEAKDKSDSTKARSFLTMTARMRNDGQGEVCPCTLQWWEMGSNAYGGEGDDKRNYIVPEANTWYETETRHKVGKELGVKAMMNKSSSDWENRYKSKDFATKECKNPPQITISDTPGIPDLKFLVKQMSKAKETTRIVTRWIQASLIGCDKKGCNCKPPVRTVRFFQMITVNGNTGEATMTGPFVDNSLGRDGAPGGSKNTNTGGIPVEHDPARSPGGGWPDPLTDKAMNPLLLGAKKDDPGVGLAGRIQGR